METLALRSVTFPTISVSRSRWTYRPIRCSIQPPPPGYFISLYFTFRFRRRFIYGLFCPVDKAEKFLEASKKGNVIPLYRCIFSDHLTPVLAYRCLVKEDERDAPSFLFESAEPGLQISSIVSNFILFFVVVVLMICL